MEGVLISCAPVPRYVTVFPAADAFKVPVDNNEPDMDKDELVEFIHVEFEAEPIRLLLTDIIPLLVTVKPGFI